jgi:hypothetical protein
MKQPRTRSTAPLSLAPPVADLPVTSEAPAAPPSALAEVDRLRLHNAQLQLQVDDLLIAQHARAHNDVVADRKGHAATMESLGADLRVRYALGDTDAVDPATGAITRRA